MTTPNATAPSNDVLHVEYLNSGIILHFDIETAKNAVADAAAKKIHDDIVTTVNFVHYQALAAAAFLFGSYERTTFAAQDAVEQAKVKAQDNIKTIKSTFQQVKSVLSAKAQRKIYSVTNPMFIQAAIAFDRTEKILAPAKAFLMTDEGAIEVIKAEVIKAEVQ